MLRGRQRGHLFHVLRGLLLQDIDGIVYGDDAHQPVFPVYHGQGGKIIAGEQTGHILPVVQRGDGDDVGLHHVAQNGAAVGQQQILDGHQSQQLPGGADDIAEINGLLVHAGAADVVKGLPDGHAGLQVYKLRGHDAAGAVLGVF